MMTSRQLQDLSPIDLYDLLMFDIDRSLLWDRLDHVAATLHTLSPQERAKRIAGYMSSMRTFLDRFDRLMDRIHSGVKQEWRRFSAAIEEAEREHRLPHVLHSPLP